MMEAADRRDRRQAAYVANIINLAGRPIKKPVTVEALLGIVEKRKRYKWRTAAEVMREDQERAAKAVATGTNAG
jgi:hypothetical protein